MTVGKDGAAGGARRRRRARGGRTARQGAIGFWAFSIEQHVSQGVCGGPELGGNRVRRGADVVRALQDLRSLGLGFIVPFQQMALGGAI